AQKNTDASLPPCLFVDCSSPHLLPLLATPGPNWSLGLSLPPPHPQCAFGGGCPDLLHRAHRPFDAATRGVAHYHRPARLISQCRPLEDGETFGPFGLDIPFHLDPLGDTLVGIGHDSTGCNCRGEIRLSRSNRNSRPLHGY